MPKYEISVTANNNDETAEDVIKNLELRKKFDVKVTREPKYYGNKKYFYLTIELRDINKGGRPKKLTPEQIEEIKIKLKNGEYKARIGREYGVSYNKINEISKMMINNNDTNLG